MQCLKILFSLLYADIMLIIISGFAGSGKSSLADALGKKLGLKVVHASSLLREMKEKGVSALDQEKVEKLHDWWESEEGKKFMKMRSEDTSLDIALDKKLIEIAKKGNIVLDSWTMPYLYKGNAFRVWLNASAEIRAKRVSGRDKLDFNDVLGKIKARDSETKDLYERLYNFKMGKELGKFNLVINTGELSQEEVFNKVLDAIQKEGV